MELTYVSAESAVKQPEIEVGVTTVYFRHNFQQVERTRMDSEEPELVWRYDEASLSKDEALHLLAERQASAAQTAADADAMNVDQEYRLTMLELGLTDTDI